MSLFLILTALAGLSLAGFQLGRGRARARAAASRRRLHSLPGYYGFYVALWCGLPALLVLFLWLAFEPMLIEQLLLASLPDELQQGPTQRLDLLMNDIRNLASGAVTGRTAEPALMAAAQTYTDLRQTGMAALAVVALTVAGAGLIFARARIGPEFRARNRVEKAVRMALVLGSTVAVLTTLGIVLSLLFEAIRFFHLVPFTDFLFGFEWSPQTAIREGQQGSSGLFGAVPLFAGTLLITLISMLVAGPIGLFSAIYMAEYASPRFRAVAKPVLEILAGIPTVVFGFFAALTVAPAVRAAGGALGLGVSSESALAAGLVMGIMIIPFVSSLSDDAINAVPQELRDGSYALGATKSETIRQVVLPAALPGIVGALLLAVSRAIGETMIVLMAAGLAANLTANPLSAVTTVTVQIVTLLVGDQEFDSAKTLAAFALALVLFAATLVLNIVALHIVRRYRERYA
jgi:phosphate transport system permease protein